MRSVGTPATRTASTPRRPDLSLQVHIGAQRYTITAFLEPSLNTVSVQIKRLIGPLSVPVFERLFTRADFDRLVAAYPTPLSLYNAIRRPNA